MTWQKILAQGFSSAAELLKYLNLPVHMGSPLAEQQFKTRVPRGFAARMEPGNREDPLLLQVLAVAEEMADTVGYVSDPLEEKTSNPIPGLIHKYKGRVLLTLTGTCAVNCRYCFRRHFPYQDNNPGRAGWMDALDYIHRDTSIHEVILSGGDPLLASDAVLQALMTQVADIAHLRTLRWHTRIPVVLPERITPSFLALLEASPLRKVMVLHCNHPREINAQVRAVCAALRVAGCTLLNQSVLLKGVNDDAQTLADLSETLFDCGVLPYYLHVLDKVTGAAHFDIALSQARAIYRQLQAQVPGYLLPKLVCELPGERSKTFLGI